MELFIFFKFTNSVLKSSSSTVDSCSSSILRVLGWSELRSESIESCDDLEIGDGWCDKERVNILIVFNPGLETEFVSRELLARRLS